MPSFLPPAGPGGEEELHTKVYRDTSIEEELNILVEEYSIEGVVYLHLY